MGYTQRELKALLLQERIVSCRKMLLKVGRYPDMEQSVGAVYELSVILLDLITSFKIYEGKNMSSSIKLWDNMYMLAESQMRATERELSHKSSGNNL